jgi:hypothetical protein
MILIMEEIVREFDWNNIFTYSNGKIFWKVTPNQNIQKDQLAGYEKINSRGYKSRYVTFRGKHFVEARIIFEMHNGPIPDGLQVDHIDNNSLNNDISNFRLASPQEQCINQRIRRDNSSGFKGVSFHKQSSKWQAQISIDGKRVTLGRFNAPEEAYAIYCSVAQDIYGDFANLGDMI